MHNIFPIAWYWIWLWEGCSEKEKKWKGKKGVERSRINSSCSRRSTTYGWLENCKNDAKKWWTHCLWVRGRPCARRCRPRRSWTLQQAVHFCLAPPAQIPPCLCHPFLSLFPCPHCDLKQPDHPRPHSSFQLTTQIKICRGIGSKSCI